MEVSVDLRNAEGIVSFDADTMEFSVEEDTTDLQTQPVFDIKLTLTDDNELGPLSRSYDFTLVIVKDWQDPIEVAIRDAKLNEVVVEFDTRVYDLTNRTVDSLINSQID